MCTALLPSGVNQTAVNKYIISYQVIPESRILLQVVKKIFPTLPGIICFVTMFTKPTTQGTDIFHKMAQLRYRKNNAPGQTKGSRLECPFIPLFLGQYWFLVLKTSVLVSHKIQFPTPNERPLVFQVVKNMTFLTC